MNDSCLHTLIAGCYKPKCEDNHPCLFPCKNTCIQAAKTSCVKLINMLIAKAKTTKYNLLSKLTFQFFSNYVGIFILKIAVYRSFNFFRTEISESVVFFPEQTSLWWGPINILSNLQGYILQTYLLFRKK